MSLPYERTRAVIQTRVFLERLTKDKSMPDLIRKEAKNLLRHYPSEYEVCMAGKIEETAENLPFPLMEEIFSSRQELQQKIKTD